jgi:hypothetical protein
MRSSDAARRRSSHPLMSVRYAVRENLHCTVLIAWIAPGRRSLVSGRIALWSSQGAKERQ